MWLGRFPYACAIPTILALTHTLSAASIGFQVQNLTSNQPGVAAFTDPNLQNAWGLASSATSPFWVGDNATGLSTVYGGNGAPVSTIAVHIPGDGSVTGVTFTATGATSFNGDQFLFASEDGTVSGWRGALGLTGTAETLVTANATNEYKGITFADVGGFDYAYLANFGTGNVDVLKGSTGAPNLGSFLDPSLPAGYVPFNVQVLNGVLYVAYAVQNGHDELDGPGLGIVDRFNLDGTFLGRVVSQGGALDAPWGMVIAPSTFPNFAGDLLVGDFGDGKIHAYNPVTGAPLGALQDASGNDISIDGLWSLRFGNGASGGTAGLLYFTAGPDNEANGLFGDLNPTPEPGTWLLAGGFLVLLLRRARRT